jgi:hypothetical protein
MNRLIALYPTTWRARYEDEFQALLATRSPSIRERLDIVAGAVDAHLHPQVTGPERVRDRYGLGPLAGFALLVGAVLLMANGPVQTDEYGTYRDGSAALPLLVLAAILLSVGLFRVMVQLPDAEGGPFRAGLIAMIAGPTWSFMPWAAPIGLLFLLAVLGLAVGARRVGLWPAWSEVLLVVLLVVPAGFMTAMPFVPWYAMRVSGVDFLMFLGPVGGIWLVVGGLLLRGFPRRALT